MDALERLLANAEKVAREHAPIDFIERPSSGARLPKDETNNTCAEPAEVLGASPAATEATPALKEAREGVETCPAADDTKVRARGCDVYTFKDGKILIKNSMRKQLP